VFILLWAVAKVAMVAGAIVFHAPPLAFHPVGEAIACAIELSVLVLSLRAAHEDVLLGNLGMRLSVALAPLVVLHFVLSGALSLLG
jgi:hypothetical protein